MATDPYAPCPCGSGKKVKFCCQAILADMEKVTRLRENQPATALRMLEDLGTKHPENVWVVTTRAMLLFNDREFEEGKDCLEAFLARVPDDAHVIALHAVASLACDGYELAKRSIHRAFQKSHRRHANLVCNVASGVAGVMYSQGCYMSARQHLALALRYVTDAERDRLFMRLLSFERDRRIPYPLRSVHSLADYEAPDEWQKDAQRASRLSGLGCWEPAAILYSRLAEQDPDNAIVWHNLGLCRAWDGNEVAAAEALHKAASLYDDQEAAVECETLAQLFDLENTDDVAAFVQQRYTVDSVSRLLTVLDDESRLARVPAEEREEDDDSAAVYRVLDRPISAAAGNGAIERDQIPMVIAELTIYDADEEEDDADAEAFLEGLEGNDFNSALEYVSSAADNLLTVHEDSPEPDEVDTVPQEIARLHWSWHLPDEISAVERADLEQAEWTRLINDTWPTQPLGSLNGRPPAEVAGDEQLRVPLRAALTVFDALCEQGGHSADFGSLRQSLNIPESAPYSVGESTLLSALSPMQMHRLPLGELNDEQLAEIVDRAVLIGHGEFVSRVMTEVAGRPECVNSVGPARVYKTLADVSLIRHDRESALKWVEAGRVAATDDENSFQAVLEWDFRELEIRLQDPADEKVDEVVRRIRTVYGSKIPQVFDMLARLLSSAGRDDLIDEPAAVVSGESSSEGGVWTPDSSSGGGEGEKKLWLPGQE